jgi:predicted RNase H-like HicB family nuclease
VRFVAELAVAGRRVLLYNGMVVPGVPDQEARMSIQLTAVYQQVPEGYIAFVEELPGANTQGATLEEARANLQEAVALVLDANRELARQAVEDQDVIREPFLISAP